VLHHAPRLGPDVEVVDDNVGTGDLGRAEDLHGRALLAVGAGAAPVLEGEVAVLDAVSRGLGLRGPEGVEV